MKGRAHVAAATLAAVLAACGDSTSAPALGLPLAEPSAVAVFRGISTKHPGVHPYLAIANAASNDLAILDALDDTPVPAPVTLRPTLVLPAPVRPMLLASAELGDDGPDLLVVVSAGDSRLQVVRTWSPDGAIVAVVPLAGDVLALVALPPPAPGQARLAAALSGGQVAVVTFRRSAVGDAIELGGEPLESGALGFQPVALAIVPGDGSRVWAATPDLDGVAQLDVDGATGQPSWPGTLLNALAPTRLVAAARLAERGAGVAQLDPIEWTTTAPVDRVYAILDEGGCGEAAAIPCGLVALDPTTSGLVPDDYASGELPYRAPIRIPGRALALAAAGPPALPASAAPFMPIAHAGRTTGIAAVASSDGTVYLADLGRWVIPTSQSVWRNVGAEVTSVRPPSAPPDAPWLVLLDPSPAGTTVAHDDAAGLAAAVATTPGYTPTARWTVTYEGVVPGLSSRRAEAGLDGSPWLALQARSGSAFTEVVRLADPTIGVRPGDVVVVDPSSASPPLAGCAGPFEASVAEVRAPDPALHPGGAVQLAPRDPGNAAWTACLDAITGAVARLRATIRSGGYVLVRGSGAAAVHAGRPELGAPLTVELDRSFYVPESCGGDETCLARFGGEVTDVAGRRALAFTLALEGAGDPVRGLALVIDTSDGRDAPDGRRALLRASDPGGAAANARAVVPFDRSRYVPGAGVRFLVPYASGVVLDAAASGGEVSGLR